MGRGMTAITLNVTFTGTPDSFDRDAAILVVDQENTRRSLQRPPLPPLPKTPGNALKSSYLSVLSRRVTDVHLSYAKQAAEKELESTNARELWQNATPAQRAAAITALTS